MSIKDEDLPISQDRFMDALEYAWTIIANAHGGNWNEATPEWREAAERWRDEYWHPLLDEYVH